MLQPLENPVDVVPGSDLWYFCTHVGQITVFENFFLQAYHRESRTFYRLKNHATGKYIASGVCSTAQNACYGPWDFYQLPSTYEAGYVYLSYQSARGLDFSFCESSVGNFSYLDKTSCQWIQNFVSSTTDAFAGTGNIQADEYCERVGHRLITRMTGYALFVSSSNPNKVTVLILILYSAFIMVGPVECNRLSRGCGWWVRCLGLVLGV